MVARRQMLGYLLVVLLLLVLSTWTEWQIRNATAALHVASFTGAEWKIRNATAALDAANIYRAAAGCHNIRPDARSKF
jgi:hypothetical protein